MNRQGRQEVAKIASTVEPGEIVDRWANAVIGAAIEVHKLLGPGFIESIYEEALCIELMRRKIPYERQAAIGITYKEIGIGEGRVDILVGGVLIVELKAVESLLPIHTAQLLSYLSAATLHLGLLINFKVPKLGQGIKRVVRT